MDSCAIESPFTTLGKLGIKDPSSLGVEVLKYSPPNKDLNAQVYARVNEVLEVEIQREALDCIHITGEMRALSDPHHRRVCRENWQAHKKRIEMVCYLPKNYRVKGRDVWRWNLRNWEKKDWKNHLDAYDLLGNGEVRLFALAHREPIHYSVFFDKYVLLQSEHMPPSHTKRVWLLNSPRLTERLREKAKQIISRAEQLSPWVFRELCLSLTSPLAIDYLFTIRDRKVVKEEWLKSRFKRARGLARDPLDDLIGVRFVRRANSNVELTQDGHEFLELVLDR